MKNKLRSMLIIFVSIFLILISVNISSAVTDCSTCHKTEPGKISIKAADTIEINDKTCLKCHNPDYPPSLMGYNTHLAHAGKYSAKVDYLTRHPKTADSLNCDNCHMNIGENCQNCHIKKLPHLQPPLGYNCKGCHGEVDKLFRHPSIDLKIHDLFGPNNIAACAMCHNPDNMASLKIASGYTIPMQESYRLCFQCHSSYYRLWDSSLHYSNKTIPSDKDIRKSLDVTISTDVSMVRTRLENKWRRENTCVNCHNPHNPSELYQLPMTGPGKISNVSIIDVIKSNLLYILILIVIVIMAVFIIKKKKLELPKLELSKLKSLKLKSLKLPKLKLPKISIPISISIDDGETNEEPKSIKDGEKPKPTKGDNGDEEPKVAVPNGDDGDEEPKVTIPKTEKKKFLRKHRNDILFILVICMMFGSFYVIFGTFMPMAVVVSESMSPHMEKGDIIFYTDISKVDKIGTYDKKSSKSFENYGDVILYKPFGKDGVTPFVHRAMYYVNQDDEMWPGGSKAPHAGYITKGDNIGTNRQYDQQLDISRGNPIKREWIVGVARFRIPYIGYIRLMLS